MYWPAFGRSAAPMICDFYSNTAAGKEKLPVLDLCCGTGDLALHFLQNGFPVTGVDISAGMLDLA
ncbi:MAG: methyltransferase domain-containing protein, partial [Calditrichaeota bacterium]|nr:methyltransferase domain-containing protein [Calditrichota bacterium]